MTTNAPATPSDEPVAVDQKEDKLRKEPESGGHDAAAGMGTAAQVPASTEKAAVGPGIKTGAPPQHPPRRHRFRIGGQTYASRRVVQPADPVPAVPPPVTEAPAKVAASPPQVAADAPEAAGAPADVGAIPPAVPAVPAEVTAVAALAPPAPPATIDAAGDARREATEPPAEGRSDEAAERGGSRPFQPTVPRPSRRERLSPDLERELNEALANIPLDTLAEDNLATPVSQPLEADTHVRARVSRIHGDNIFFALGGRNEGVASLRQFKQPPSIGTEIEVVVRSPNEDDGLYELAIPGASIDVGSWEDLVEGAVVEARITGANTGGLECMVNNIRGFIPASQIGTFRVEDFAEYIGQKLLCVTTEVNRRRKNLVLSHRAVMEREKEEARRKFIEEIEPGQTREGVVRSIQDFGAFVDLGGVDGLIHISQLSWDRVNHPSEVLQEGQKVRVKVEKINRETGKIGLSYRDLLEHPWSNAEQRFPAGAVVRGQVSRIAKFGAFVKLAPGVEGLVHVSEMAHQHVRRVNDVVSEGQEIEVKVLSVDAAAQRMALSIKAALPEPAPEEVAPDEKGESERPDLSTQPTRPKRPLKGGVDRPSGGEKFGLKW